MADNTKQGPKDITDLKARLGLKKQGGGPAGPGGPAVPGPAAGAPFAPAPIPGPQGVAAPRPGQAAPSPFAGAGPAAGQNPAFVPPPPGFAPPPEAAPAQPDPRRDPYAAQQAAVAANLASFYGAGALPGSADEVKGEPIKKAKPWGIIGGGVALALAMLGVGYSIGNIAERRQDLTIATEHAVQIRDEVTKMTGQVDKIAEALKGVKLSDTAPPDFAAIDKLADVDFKEPDMPTKLFHTNYFSFEPSLVQQLFTYYNDTLILSKQLQEHTARTKNDRESIEKFIKSNGSKETQQRGPTGVILDYSQKLPVAQLVELGGVECPDKNVTNCQPEEAKLKFRTALGGVFQARPLKGLPKDIVLPIQPTELQKQVASGDPGLLAFRDYVRRAANMYQQITKLKEEQKALIAGLKKRVETSPL